MNRNRLHRATVCTALILTALTFVAGPTQGAEYSGPSIVARSGDQTLAVGSRDEGVVLLYRQDSTSPRQAISSTHSTIVGARLVDGGVNGVLFSSWQDQDGAAYTAISLDHGETWKPERVIHPTIALRAATLVPGEQVTAPAPKYTAGSDSQVRIVQFETQSLAAWRQRLVELGAELLAFIPHNAHVVRMSSDVERNVAAEPFVRWIGAYHPAYRLEPGLLDELNGPNLPPRRFVLQTFRPGPTEKSALA
ncbi:MAG: hypothetical protein ABFS37_16340 [Acidobacteriota bacterium]